MKGHPIVARIRDYGITVEELDGCILVVEKSEHVDAQIALNAMVRNEGFRFKYPSRYYYEIAHARLSFSTGITTTQTRCEFSHDSLVDRAWDCKKFHALIIPVGKTKTWSGDTGFLVYPTRRSLPE